MLAIQITLLHFSPDELRVMSCWIVTPQIWKKLYVGKEAHLKRFPPPRSAAGWVMSCCILDPQLQMKVFYVGREDRFSPQPFTERSGMS